MKLEIELPFSEAQQPLEWIERLRAEIIRICEENDLDSVAFIQEPPQ
jgi:hypothetical protein